MKRIFTVFAGILLSVAGYLTLSTSDATVQEETPSPIGRWDYELMRLADPVTGEMPEGIRMRELAFSSTLPKYRGSRDSVAMTFKSVGPYNLGGRTRAFAIDVTNSNTYIAGAVSGGIWRSTNAGQTWKKVTRPEDHHATSCITQDTRTGKENTWYYSSGEVTGNSASKSFSAYYRGSGVWKSIDSGLTWTLIQSTATEAQKSTDWDEVHAISIDPLALDSDVVLAATKKGIMRSADGGDSWEVSLGSNGTADYTYVTVSSTGVYYAAISSNVTATAGMYRSPDGINWTKISPNGFVGNHSRTLISIAPSNEDVVYFFSEAPGVGENGSAFYKYEYLSGDGSGTGGDWTNRTSGLASASFNPYGGYCQVLKVKPDDENMVFLGGTSLYRSKNAFADTFQVTRIGGYSIDGREEWGYFNGGGEHYPDQQNLFFDPQDPDVLVSTTDGGVHRANDCTLDTMYWDNLNNGYISSQFYGIAIDQATAGSHTIIGGLQDRGTWWSNDADDMNDWTHIRGADGAYCDVEDGGGHFYLSTQYANIQRRVIDQNAQTVDNENIMPKQLGRGSGNGWLFVHPFTLDRVNNDVMYLPNYGSIWRNLNITSPDSTTLFSSWKQICDVGGRITAVSASESHQGVVYFGTSNSRIYRLDSAHLNQSVAPIPASDSISNGGYASNIAIDPNDPLKAIAVFSNYNCKSLWYTTDGGADWESIEGNLKGESEPGVPASLSHISDGPSIRWAEIVPTEGGNIYFIGTSIGLFSTQELNGDSTVWVQQGVETIGNVVVDMLFYRESDGWLVVGTHGNGIYTANIEYFVIGQEELSFEQSTLDFDVYPNPASDQVHIRVNETGSYGVELYDQMGRMVYKTQLADKRQHYNVLSSFRPLPGTYYLRLSNGSDVAMKPVIIQ